MEPRAKRRFSWIELFVLLGVLAVAAAIFSTHHGRVRSPGMRSVDASNIRSIAISSLIYAEDHGGKLPGLGLNQVGEIAEGSTTPNLHAIAAALARHGYLNDAHAWISTYDRHPEIRRDDLDFVLSHEDPRILSPEFAASPLSFQFVAGLKIGMHSSTPIVFTRGLRPDGRWDRDRHVGVYGGDGGHIVFLGGNMGFYEDLRHPDRNLKTPVGSSTTNILETIDARAQIFSDPATATGRLDGMPGVAPRE